MPPTTTLVKRSASYWNPTRRVIGDGALESLPQILSEFRPHRVLLVMGGSSFRRSSRYGELLQGLAGFRCVESVPVQASPSIAFVEQMRRDLAAEKPDLVVAIGGGSVIDCAKALRLLLTQERQIPVEDYLSGPAAFSRRGLPFIAVPTTAGTGSEVTQYASLKTRDERKVSLTHPWLFPEVALVDPTLTLSMPAYVTACTGLDALSQAIESFWSVHATPFSQPHSLRAVSLIARSFERVLADPNDREARLGMSLASTEAGLAISQSRTTAVHAASYPLTTFFHIPHGHACALTLPSFVRYNEAVMDPLRSEPLWHAMGVSSWEAVAETVERWMDQAGLERSLRKLGLEEADLSLAVEHGARSDRAGNNPREVTPETLRGILSAIL